ncbi:D-alanine--D-alanine ligase [Candidatus Uhrbacteria bacterium]|nr:D-alanine--D-alanine ligase [Candidatus Uhrbacteria bacterium]
MSDRKLRVVVLCGGTSPEHEVSLATGRTVASAFDRTKYDVQTVTIAKDGQWLLPNIAWPPLDAAESNGNLVPAAFDVERAIEQMKRARAADVVFIALHGAGGEDGTIQGLLECAGIPYTGSGVLASALAMDKVRSAQLFTASGLRVPKFQTITRSSPFSISHETEKGFRAASEEIDFPRVVKPSNCGSSVGVSIVRSADQLDAALQQAFVHGDTALVQEYIAGTEVTCAVLDDGEPIALPPTEIVPKSATFFDYGAKYTPGASEEITPPRLPPDVIHQIQSTALQAHRILGCFGMSRTDMISAVDGGIVVLETNTIPGMTETSLLPQAAAAAGIPFPALLDRLIHAALARARSTAIAQPTR